MRGRYAETPGAIPRAGWLDVLVRVKNQITKDHIGLVAAGIAFYALLALFPGITALMAVAGLLLEPQQVTEQLQSVAQVMPAEAADIVIGQAVDVAGSEDAGLGLAAIIGLLLALYSASKGVGSLIDGLNVAYDEDETRGFIVLTALKLGLTVLLVLGAILGLASAALLPAAFAVLDLGPFVETLASVLRWVLLATLTMLGLAVLYRLGPSRSQAQWRWLTPGAVLATLAWLAASLGFAVYVSNFASYNESFGSLGGVVVLLMWLWISAYVVLLGAELNSELEAQTRVDTTVGPDLPMGQRGAVKADRLGPTRDD